MIIIYGYNFRNSSGRADKYNYVIFILAIILSILVCYIAFKTTLTAKTYIPRNSVNVSPLTGKRVTSVFASSKPIEVTYTATENTVSLNGISNAEIIYEYMDKNGLPYYKALFAKNPPKKIPPVVKIGNAALKLLPKLNFIDIFDLPSDFTHSAESIFVTLSYNVSSNFIYENGEYHHYRDTYKDIDNSTSNPVSVSNLLIQFVDQNTKIDSPYVNGSGKGLLFCGGKVFDIKWDKEGRRPIKITDEEGNPVSLIRGKTWWIVLPENSSVAYN